MSGFINENLAQRAVMNTADMTWQSSPSGTVYRKRVHLVGETESGQVTSIVRYRPGATFPAHDHPEGEEIFVIEGVFSDEYGDWPAGTYLLNPEGFRHAPFSHEGCLLLVKLRQYPGRDRQRVSIDTTDMNWQPTPEPGVREKRLYRQEAYTDVTRLELWSAGVHRRKTVEDNGLEIYVLRGELQEGEADHPAGSWLRFPRGYRLDLGTERGCTVYVKSGGFTYLRSARVPA